MDKRFRTSFAEQTSLVARHLFAVIVSGIFGIATVVAWILGHLSLGLFLLLAAALLIIVSQVRAFHVVRVERDAALQRVVAAEAEPRASMSNISVAESSGVAVGFFSGPPQVPVVPSARRRAGIDDFVRNSDRVARNLVFEDSDIVGPMILLPIGDKNVFSESDLGADPATLFWEVVSGRNRVVGVVPIDACTFRRCRFIDVGLAGPRHFLDVLNRGVGEAPPSLEHPGDIS